jgi:hypothetical protein
MLSFPLSKPSSFKPIHFCHACWDKKSQRVSVFDLKISKIIILHVFILLARGLLLGEATEGEIVNSYKLKSKRRPLSKAQTRLLNESLKKLLGHGLVETPSQQSSSSSHVLTLRDLLNLRVLAND